MSPRGNAAFASVRCRPISTRQEVKQFAMARRPARVFWRLELRRMSEELHTESHRSVADQTEMPLPSELSTVFLWGLFLLALLAAVYAAREIVLPVVLAFVLHLPLGAGLGRKPHRLQRRSVNRPLRLRGAIPARRRTRTHCCWRKSRYGSAPIGMGALDISATLISLRSTPSDPF